MTSSALLPPLVFIHGWKASVLTNKHTNKDEFDYTLGKCLGISSDPDLELPLELETDGTQVKDDLIPTSACHSATADLICVKLKVAPIYGPLLDHLHKTRDLHVFAYDWRMCLDETVAKFEQFLLDVTQRCDGQAPQVIGHSMGCLITLHLLNKRPELFHSILFGAGAMSPNASLLHDFSIMGEKNTIVKNTTMFTPKINLSNPSAIHFLAYPGERELYGKPNTTLFRKEDTDMPVELDLHNVETWKKYKLGYYHPQSGCADDVTDKMEKWLQIVLNKAYNFRRGLLPTNSGLKASDCPPIACLRGDHEDTDASYVVRSSSGVDFHTDVGTLRGDGRVLLEDAVPPNDIPVIKIVTNDKEHSQVLNDIENVQMLLDLLIAEKQ